MQYSLSLKKRNNKSRETIPTVHITRHDRAFDHAFWPFILHQLRKKKCPKNLYFIIKSFLNDREAILVCGREYITKN